MGFTVSTLDALVEGVTAVDAQLPVGGITSDSREVVPGSVFFAIQGSKADGRKFISQAIERGACAVVVQDHDSAAAPAGVPHISVPDIRRAYALACARHFGNPSESLLSIGITGTNGKTSVAWITAHILTALGLPAGICGTLGVSARAGAGEIKELSNTTPDSKIIQRFLAESLSSGTKAAVLEATSQGIAHCRTVGTSWDAAVFTNLTRDHLDLHGTMEAYGAVKVRLFTEELASSSKQSRVAVVNIDDPFGNDIVRAVGRIPEIRCVTYSPSGKAADARIVAERCSMLESKLEAEIFGVRAELTTRLVGNYNVANVLASALTLAALDHPADAVAEALRSVPPVPGRLEVLNGGEFQVVVDYAHTPDGLVQAQRSLRPLTKGRLITVFGCGGDRDRGKRPIMGEVVAQMSDLGVLTSDNPRTEEPERIIDDMVPGIAKAARAEFSWHRQSDRRKAIAWALQQAKAGDVVLIAGKGHEDYQEIHGIKHPFSDQQMSREVLRDMGVKD